MTTLEQQKIIEVVLYVLNKTGGMDYYHLFKILYFANQRSLVEWGHLMTADKFCALPHGPVPTELYDAIKGNGRVLPQLKESIFIEDYYLLPKREADPDYLSPYDIEVLDDAIAQYGKMSFTELKKTSHTQCWEAARKKPGSHVIDVADMARDGGASEDVVKYIHEMVEWDEAFGS